MKIKGEHAGDKMLFGFCQFKLLWKVNSWKMLDWTSSLAAFPTHRRSSAGQTAHRRRAQDGLHRHLSVAHTHGYPEPRRARGNRLTLHKRVYNSSSWNIHMPGHLGGSVDKCLRSAQVMIPRSWDWALWLAPYSARSLLLPLLCPSPCSWPLFFFLSCTLSLSLSLSKNKSLKIK